MRSLKTNNATNRATAAWIAIAIAFATASVLTAGQALAADSEVPTDFLTIQAAIDDAGTVAGDTITVVGTHVENDINITKAVTIQGQGTGSTFVQLSGGIGFRPETDGITLKKMTIEQGSQAIRFEKAAGTIDDTTLQNLRIRNNTSRGIEVHNDTTVTNLLIKNCTFRNTSTGLRVSSSGHLEGVQFLDSTFRGNTIGIYEANDGGTSTMKDVEIRGCTFRDHSGQAIFLEEIQDAVIEDNDFIDNWRDIQIFKWYQASVPVSSVLIRNNTSTGATNACFAIFNAEHSSGQTEFDGVTYTGNSCSMAGGATRAVYAGGHSGVAGAGGIGWDTVSINCNDFTGNYGLGVDYFDPTAVDSDTLGGATLDVTNNWWGTADSVAVAALMELPSITDYDPFLVAPTADPVNQFCPEPELLATKTDALEVDVYGDGNFSPTDTVRYTVMIENLGGSKARGVRFDDTPDPLTKLVAGSVTTDKGNAVILQGNDPGDTVVEVNLKGIAVGKKFTVEFDVVIGNPLTPAEIAGGLSNQGTFSGNNFFDVLTDDPDDPSSDSDPTLTPLAGICDGVVPTNGCTVNDVEDRECIGTSAIDVILGTEGDDVIVGRGRTDYLVGLGGADLLCGNGGGDTLDGGLGPDILVGDRGRDLLAGGPGDDVIDGGPGNDFLNGGTDIDICIDPNQDNQTYFFENCEN